MSIIQNKDIYDSGQGNPFKAIEDALELLDTKIDKVKKSMIGFESALQKTNKTGSGQEAKILIDNTQKLAAETDKLTRLQTARNKIDESAKQIMAQILVLDEKRSKNLAKAKLLQEQRNKTIKDQIKLESDLVGAYEKETIKLNQLRKAYKDLAIQNKENTKEGRAMLANIQAIDARLKKVDGSVGQFQRNVGNYTGALRKNLMDIAGMMAAYFSVDTIINFGKSIVSTTAKFEKYGIVLENTLGSKSEAQKSMKVVSDFAASTPFSVDELTASYVKLANQGFKPTNDEMARLGDLASSTGKGFDQLTEALIDAQTGEFERLKEFGIRAKKSGDDVTFSFKGVDTTVKFTNESIRSYILSLGDLEGVQGANAKIAETLSGQISNLGDSWDQLLVALGESTKGGVSSALNWLKEGIDSVTKSVRILNSETSTAEQRTDAWINILHKISPILGLFAEKVSKAKYGIFSMIPVLENALDLLSDMADKFLGIQIFKTDGPGAPKPYIKSLQDMREENDANLKKLKELEAYNARQKTITPSGKTGSKAKKEPYDPMKDPEIQAYLAQNKAANEQRAFLESQELELTALEKAQNDERVKSAQDAEQAIWDMKLADAERAQELRDEELEKEREYYEQRNSLIADTADMAGQMFGELLATGELTMKEFGKIVLISALDLAEKMIMISIAEMTAKQIAQKGWLGIASAALLGGVIKGTFTALKANIQAFATGTEYVQGQGTETSDSIPARLSKGERVVPAAINKQLMGISNKDLPKIVNNGINTMRLENLLHKVDENTSISAYYLSNLEVHHEDAKYKYYKDVKTGITHRIIKE
jgi:hypothetical protein